MEVQSRRIWFKVENRDSKIGVICKHRSETNISERGDV